MFVTKNLYAFVSFSCHDAAVQCLYIPTRKSLSCPNSSFCRLAQQ